MKRILVLTTWVGMTAMGWDSSPLERLRDLRTMAMIGASYKSKALCSGVFVEGKAQALVESEDLAAADPRLGRIKVEIEDALGQAIARVLLPRPIERRSVFLDERLGCSLVETEESVPFHVSFNGLYAADRWGNFSFASHRSRVALDRAFSFELVSQGVRTEAMVVIQNGEIIGEAYRSDTRASQRLQGWSMSKSLTSAMVGRAYQLGLLSSRSLPKVPEWNSRFDARSQIGFGHLLQMTSGLKFDENYDDALSDVNRMLFGSRDMAAYAAAMPLESAPGQAFKYSSGSTNIAARALREVFQSQSDYIDFPHRELFAKLGMTSAVFEVDRTGTYVGSSGAYASARDWAKFGQLYLQEGQWNGEQILSKSWVNWSRTPVAASPRGEYGAGFWTNGFAGMPQSRRPWPSLPADAYAAIGYLGQMVLVIPSRGLVVVRLGSDSFEGAWTPEIFAQLFQGILAPFVNG